MANLNKIGIFLSNDKVIFVESNRDRVEKVIPLPVVSASPVSGEDTSFSELNEEIQIVALMQKILRENKIEAGPVSVAVPTKDLFLRSFVIPFMPPNEVQSVVFFEAKKYVPFDLKLLDYSFKTIPFVENKQKFLRVIFYGVRKQTLEKYDRILKQIGCTPLTYEPALVSLAKQLIVKKFIDVKKTVVFVYVHEDHGQIVFYEKGISFFFRDFPLSASDINDPSAAPEGVRMQLLREIRKSFEYYSRQFSKQKISEILVFSSVLDKELVNSFAEELELKVIIVDSLVNIGDKSITDIDSVAAYGACIVNKSISFNFVQSRLVSQQGKDDVFVLPWYVSEFLTWNFSEFIYAIQAAVICILILAGGFAFSTFDLQKFEKEVASLNQRLGVFSEVPLDSLKNDIGTNEHLLKSYQEGMVPSNISYLIVSVVKALPEGCWLNSIRIHLNESNNAIVEFSGSVYATTLSKEYKKVNELIQRLKDDPVFLNSKFINNSMQKQVVDDKSIVVFSVSNT